MVEEEETSPPPVTSTLTALPDAVAVTLVPTKSMSVVVVSTAVPSSRTVRSAPAPLGGSIEIATVFLLS